MNGWRVLDLFSGIGGFSLGLERAGMRTVAFCEIDGYCRRVLARHWPGVRIYHDVRELTGAKLSADGIVPNVICGGFPCQDISVAGRGEGLAGRRSGLWKEYARIIGEVRPDLAIVENVAALLNRGLDQVLGDLAALGFDAEWHCIPAAAVGAPHRRDRIWIVAYATGKRRGEARGDCERSTQRTSGGGDVLAHAQRPEWRTFSETRDIPWAERLCERAEGPARTGSGGSDVADTEGLTFGTRLRAGLAAFLGRGRSGDGSGPDDVSDPEIAGLERRLLRRNARPLVAGPGEGCRPIGGDWSTEPDVGRVAHGIPARVDRLRGLGNAVVPQIPELIGKAIIAAERERVK